MDQQITIRLPDELFDRSNSLMNYFDAFAICQRAIEQELDRREHLAKRGHESQAIVERLRSEKKAHDECHGTDGYRQGCKDVRTMEYAKFLNLAALEDECLTNKRAQRNISEIIAGSKEEGEPSVKYEHVVLNDYDRISIIRHSLVWKQLSEHTNDLKQYDGDFNEGAYLAGWYRAVMDFWGTIKDDL